MATDTWVQSTRKWVNREMQNKCSQRVVVEEGKGDVQPGSLVAAQSTGRKWDKDKLWDRKQWDRRQWGLFSPLVAISFYSCYQMSLEIQNSGVGRDCFYFYFFLFFFLLNIDNLIFSNEMSWSWRPALSGRIWLKSVRVNVKHGMCAEFILPTGILQRWRNSAWAHTGQRDRRSLVTSPISIYAYAGQRFYLCP